MAKFIPIPEDFANSHLMKQVLKERNIMAQRLIEIEEIGQDDDGVLYWDSCGEALVGERRVEE